MVSGVRRWITSHPATPATTKKPHRVNKAAIRLGEQKPIVELELDKHSTEVMARHSLNPVVPEAEEAEYQGYCKLLYVDADTNFAPQIH